MSTEEDFRRVFGEATGVFDETLKIMAAVRIGKAVPPGLSEDDERFRMDMPKETAQSYHDLAQANVLKVIEDLTLLLKDGLPVPPTLAEALSADPVQP